MKKLTLNKEVLRKLDVEEVQAVVGGRENSRTVCKASTRAALCPEPKPQPVPGTKKKDGCIGTSRTSDGMSYCIN